MSSALKISIVIAILLVSQVAFGQRGRGGFRGGGDRGGGDYGGRGFQRGGPDQGSGRFQRGGPDQRGGGDSNRPAPSDDSGRGSSRTAEFLKKLDANGNGMIEASEATDPGAKDVLERVFKKAGMEPHYPVLIADLLKGDASSGSPSSGVASKSPAAGLMSPPGMGFGSPPTSGGGSASTSSSTPVTPTFSSTAGANSPTSPLRLHRHPHPWRMPSQFHTNPPVFAQPWSSCPRDYRNGSWKKTFITTAKSRWRNTRPTGRRTRWRSSIAMTLTTTVLSRPPNA